MLSDWEKSHWKGRRNSHRQCTGTCTFATNQTFRHHRKFECTKFCFSLLLQKSNKNCFHIKKHTKNALIPVPQYQVILVFKIDFISFAGSICKQRIYDKSAKSPIDTTLTHQTRWILVLWRQSQSRGKNTKSCIPPFIYVAVIASFTAVASLESCSGWVISNLWPMVWFSRSQTLKTTAQSTTIQPNYCCFKLALWVRVFLPFLILQRYCLLRGYCTHV